MTYLLALLYLICVYVRPGEIFPGWEGFPFLEILAGVSAVSVAGSLVVRPRRLWNLPHDGFVLGFFIAIIVSNVAWGWLGGGYQAVIAMAPALFCYFLFRSAIESPRQLQWIRYALISVTLFHAFNGIVQFQTGVGLGDVVPIEAQSVSVDGEDDGAIRRIRGTGIFNDPNDLALALVIVVPFLTGPLVRRATPLGGRLVAFLLLIPIVVALYLTNSRGGVVGFAAALLPYLYRRFGKVAGPVLATSAFVALLALGPSRTATIDPSEPSAQGRVQSWSEGLQMFRSRPLFGVGFGRYTDFNDLVAHNSFVHTLGELGLVGSFFFVGMGYWFFQSARQRVDHQRPDSEGIELRGWGEDLWQSGLGFAVCAMFLSQQYSVLLFVWIAMSACYLHVLQDITLAPASRPVVHLTRIAGITVGALICTYTVVRIFASTGA
jgi:O-Antigen ligase